MKPSFLSSILRLIRPKKNCLHPRFSRFFFKKKSSKSRSIHFYEENALLSALRAISFYPVAFHGEKKHWEALSSWSSRIAKNQANAINIFPILSDLFEFFHSWWKVNEKKKEIKRKREIEGEWWMISSTGRCMVGRVDDQRSPSLKKRRNWFLVDISQ